MRRTPTIAVAVVASLLALASASPSHAQQTVGVFVNTPDASPEYTVFTPLASTETYLIDLEGKQINQWSSAYFPGVVTYLRDNGNLLRTARFVPPGGSPFAAGGQGGRIEEFDWDGTLVWDFDYSDQLVRHHHDIEELPNGNILILAWELKTMAESIQAGRNPGQLVAGELWPEHIVEVEPGGVSGGTIVWEWHLWDHLIQDFDITKDNFGVVADHPELVDINYVGLPGADWIHANAIDYNAELDQIMISANYFSELWVIDHSTTTAEAAGHTGGNSGKGGDLLYRWGNPAVYRRGTATDQTLFRQHDAQWIEPGLPGEGNILIFNNGVNRPGGNYSSVDELVPPVDGSGNYTLNPGQAYGPTSLLWTYDADPNFFYSSFVSGAQRLPNGNTLVCAGPQGTFTEVNASSETVWLYVSPATGAGTVNQGASPGGNAAFRAYRYPADLPGLQGEDLTPGDPLEGFTAPNPVPAGEGTTTPLLASRLSERGDEILVEWDAASCTAVDYNVIYGNLADVGSYAIQGGDCAVGLSGSHTWTSVPGDSLFFLVVGVDSTGVYESSWGGDSQGAERNATAPSNVCGATNKIVTETCL